jgi:hypothetical protein
MIKKVTRVLVSGIFIAVQVFSPLTSLQASEFVEHNSAAGQDMPVIGYQPGDEF